MRRPTIRCPICGYSQRHWVFDARRAVYPQTELGGDPGAIRVYGRRAEELGYRHILVYDHVVGADPTVHTGWGRAYDVHTTFSEPMVMFGYLADVTQKVGLARIRLTLGVECFQAAVAAV